jgi:peroxiredoxin
MKKILVIVISCFVFSQGMSQVPESATDISPLLIGEQVPETEVTSLEGTRTSLLSLVEEQPAVVIFYRGSWCPYCNVHLAALQEIETNILDYGYKIIAVSPDDISNLTKAIEKNSLSYTLVSDSDLALAKAFGIAFKAPQKYQDMLSTHSGGENTGLLPVPSVFIIDQEGTILFEYINPNYKERISSQMLLGVLKSLSE